MWRQILLCIGAVVCLVGWWLFDNRYDHTVPNWIELDPDGAVNAMLSKICMFVAIILLFLAFG